MSPEQGAGQRAIGPASDVWSLGAIPYELLTGRPPFRGETAMATLQQVANKDPVPPRLFDPAISPDLETICLKCLEKEPARRYYSAEALADDLRRFLNEEPILARPVSAVARLMAWMRRKPGQALTASGALAALLLFTLFLFISHYQERQLRNEAEKAQHLAQIREEAMRHLLYLAEMRRAQQALEQADFDRVERLLKHWEPRENERDLRDWEWHFLRTHSQGPYSIHAHAYQTSAVAWRPDGKQFATAGGEPSKPGEIKIWETATGKLLATFHGHALAITSLAWHPHRNLLASGSFDKTVRLWDITLQKELATLTGHRAEVKSVAFTPAGDRLASGGRDKTIRIWNVDRALIGKGEPTMLVGHEADVNALAFAPHGDVLASASADKTVRLWSLASMTEQYVLHGHDGAVESITFGPEGTFLASGGGQGMQRGEVVFWNTQTGQRMATRFGLSNRVTSLSCNAAGLMAAGSGDGLVYIWNRAQSSESYTFRADKQITDIGFSPDGRQLAVSGASGRVSLFNASGSLETLRVPAPAAVEALAFSPAAPLVVLGGRQGSLSVWRLDQFAGPIPYAGHTATVMSAAFSPGGRMLASGGEDGEILIHDVTAPLEAPIALKGHAGPVRALVFIDDALLATASDDDTVRLWDLNAKNERQTFQHGNGVRAVAVSSDRRWLASGGVDKVVYLWDLQSGENAKLTGHTGTINALAFSPDSQQLISGSSDRTIRAWNVAEKKAEQGPDGLNTPVLALAYHPGGRRFASLGQDKTIRLWDVITRQEILELEDPTAAPRALAFSRDGRWLAAGSGNGARLWDSGK